MFSVRCETSKISLIFRWYFVSDSVYLRNNLPLQVNCDFWNVFVQRRLVVLYFSVRRDRGHRFNVPLLPPLLVKLILNLVLYWLFLVHRVLHFHLEWRLIWLECNALLAFPFTSWRVDGLRRCLPNAARGLEVKVRECLEHRIALWLLQDFGRERRELHCFGVQRSRWRLLQFKILSLSPVSHVCF